MALPSRLRRAGVSRLALLLAVTSGCDNPLWRLDRFTVEATLGPDSTCEIIVDGSAVAPDLSHDTTQAFLPQIDNAFVTTGTAVFGWGCRGLILLINGPSDGLPRPGEYHIGTPAWPVADTAIVALYSPDFRGGWWPFGFGAPSLRATTGRLYLSAVDSTHLTGRLSFTARRHFRGP